MNNEWIDPDQAYYWEESWQELEKSADSDIRAGRIQKLDRPDDLDD